MGMPQKKKLLDIQKRKGGISNGLYKRGFTNPRVLDITVILIKFLLYRNEAKGLFFLSGVVYPIFYEYE